jgi:hypothetical protein
MYRIITLLAILLLPFALQAQRSPAVVKGRVYDTLTKKGLSYATVSVVNAKDSTLVSFARADSTGKFKLNALDKGSYLLSASYVGFVPVWRSIEVKEDQELELGNINMTDLVNAGNVTVNAKRAPVTINNDTLEFNTENFKTQPNAVVEDLLKKLPGVTVDNDGTVRMNGQRINRVLVNGKEFFTGDPALATRNLEADAVDKVQVFDKKSDRAEFTGVDDGQSEKAINLKLKKDRNKALFGKATAGAGAGTGTESDGRYDAQLNMNKFNNDQQLSLIGMANNTNKQGFSISDVLNFTGELSRGMRSGGGISIRTGGGDDNGLPVNTGGPGQPGVATTIAGGLNYNDTWNNRNTDFNASGKASDINLLTDRSTFRQNIVPGSEFNYNSKSHTARDNQQQRFNSTFDHKFDSFTSIKFTPQITMQQSDARSTTSYTSEDLKGLMLNEGSTDNKTHSDAFDVSGNLLFRHRMKKKGRTISSTLSFLYNDSKQNGELYTRNLYYNNGVPFKDSLTNQHNNRDAVSRSLGGNLIYTEPIGKRSLLEIGGYLNASSGTSKRLTYDYSSGSGKYDSYNSFLSNDFKNENAYGGGTLNFRTNQKKISVTAGTSLQSTHLRSTNNSSGNVIEQTFTDMLPSANVQYRLSQTRNVSLNYTTSTTLPSTQQLQPVTDVSDPLNTYTGNPNLKRSYAQSLNLNYFSTNIYRQTNLFAFIAFNKTDNAIVNSDIIINGLRKTVPVNTDGNYVLFANVNVGLPLKKLKSRVDFGVGANKLRNNSFVNGQGNEIKNMSVSPNISYSYTLDGVVDIVGRGRWNISQAEYSLQPSLNSNYLQQVYGVDATGYLPLGIILNTTFNYTINTGRADGYNTKIPMWNASVARSFLKNKRAELKFSAFDLLNQNVGVSRNANQNYIEDTKYNVLQRYFLLSFTFSLNRAGSNANGPRVMIRTME